MAFDTPEVPPSTLDKYELVKEVAEGGFGSTWIARMDEEGDPPPLYALLRVHKNLVKKPEAIDVFVAEVQKDLALTAPNLLRTIDVGAVDGEIFVVSEYVEGESLTAVLTAAGAQGLPSPVYLRILLDVLTPVAAAHAREKPAIHGEIGPQHIRVGIDGTARLGGFGTARALAKLSVPGAKHQDRLAYAAPERVKGMASASAPQVPLEPRADVFALGVLLWEAIARQRLFASRIEAAVIQKVLTAPIAALGSLPDSKVPPQMDELVQRALERDPARRLQTAGDLAKGLQAAGSGFVASHAEVAAKVEALVGKSISERRMELAAAMGRKPPEGSARASSSTSMKAATPPAVSASRTASTSPIRPGSSAAVAAATPATSVSTPATPVASTATKPAPTVPKPAAAIARSLPSRNATMLGGIGPKVPSAVTPAAPAPPPAASASAEDWGDLALSDDVLAVSLVAKPVEAPTPIAAAAPADAPRPVVARPGPSLRNQTTQGGFNARAPAPAPPRVNVPIKVPSAQGTAADASARSITKPRAGQAIPITEATPVPTDDVGTKVVAYHTQDIEAASAEAEPKPILAGPPSDRTAGTGQTPGSAAAIRGKTASALDQIGPGSTLGRYEILMPIARGGMASVWAARLQGSRGFQKLVAIKTMLPDVSDDPDFETMFLDEATVAARIRHPNVAEIMDLGEDNDVLYLVMEWIDGENLSTVLKGAKPLGGIPLPIVLRIASQACAGLHAAHELRDDSGTLIDLIHRDVSPANVLVSTSGFVKLVDFGVAKSKNRMHVTRVGGTVKGKTPYLSPEQLGQLALDRRSDIFSFGVLLYVLATGLHPFRGETEGKTIENIALREPVPLQTINPKIPIEFEKVVLKALKKDREKRYATAAELQRALDMVAVSLGVPASDGDVADFVRQIIGEASQKRAQDIRAAIAALDGSGGSLPEITRTDVKVPESKTPKGGVEAPKPALDPLEEPLPTASTRDVPAAPARAPAKPPAKPATKPKEAGEEELSFEAELPQIGDAVSGPPSVPGGPVSSLEAVLPMAAVPPPPAGLMPIAPASPGVAEARSSSAAVVRSGPITLRPQRSKTVPIVVAATVGGVAVAAVLAMIFNATRPTNAALGTEGTTVVSALPAVSQTAPPSAIPSASSPPPEPSATVATTAVTEPPVIIDPPIFKGKFPPSGKAPAVPVKPGPGKVPPPPPPTPTKPPPKPTKYNPTGI